MRQLSINSHENNENKKQDIKIKIDNDMKSKKNKVLPKQSSKDVVDLKYNNNASHVNDFSKNKFYHNTSLTK